MDFLQNKLTFHGLSRWYNSIAALQLKSISIKTQQIEEIKLPLGASKFGGFPDLPVSIEWPVYKGRLLSFFAQLRLEELKKFDFDNLLPSLGMLYFFYDPEQKPSGYEPNSNNGWRVIYSNNTSLIKCTVPPAYISDTFELGYKPCALQFAQEITLPSWESEAITNLPLTTKEQESYYELVNEGVLHRLFGHPATIQGEMEIICQFASNGIYMPDGIDYTDPKMQSLKETASEWRLLAQFDSDINPEFYWGTEGRLYFWIQQQKLLNDDFNNVWMVAQRT